MTIEYKGIPIFFTDTGIGNPVVLLHGFLENATMWDHFIPKLSKNNRVICIDLLGHGNTGCLGYIHSMELMAEMVKSVLKHLKITKSIFVGHSMGGYVALAFIEMFPNDVSGLCLLNSTALDDSAEKKENRDRAIIAVKQNHKTFIRLAIANLFNPENQTIFSEKINDVVNEALQTPLQGIIAALEGMKIRKDRTFLLHSEGFKKMMVIGRKDPALDYNTLLEQIKNTDVKTVEFPDGHMSHIENEGELLQELMHFIEK